MQFRSLLIGSAFAVLASGAFAADIPEYVPPPPPPPPPPPVVYDWTGFYLGGQGGFGWGESHVNDFIAAPNTLDTTFDINGGFAGGVAGAQWQWNSVVLGIEAEANWSGVDGEIDVQPAIGGNFISTDINWFGSVGGKLGFAFDRVMIFGTGGVAFANIDTGQNIPLIPASFSQDENYLGFMAGGGLDFAVTNNIIAGVQARYYDFGTESYTPPAPFNLRDQEVTLTTISGHVTVKFP